MAMGEYDQENKCEESTQTNLHNNILQVNLHSK